MTLTISEVHIALIKPKNGMIGFASVVLDNSLYLGSIAIHQKLDGSGYRLTYPTKQTGAQQMNVYHPINQAASRAIENAVITKLKDVMSQSNAGYDSHYYE
jgi:stage V sporulation protein G